MHSGSCRRLAGCAVVEFIHVVPPETNYLPVYSVEHIGNNDPHKCWTQHGRTTSKCKAYLLAFEVWLRYRKTHQRRVRVL